MSRAIPANVCDFVSTPICVLEEVPPLVPTGNPNMGKTGRRYGAIVEVQRTWTLIPARATVRVGDVLLFSWQPPGWSAPATVQGRVISDAARRRSWFVAVDSQSGRQGVWLVRMGSRRSLDGEPYSPMGENWWLENPPFELSPLSKHQRPTDSCKGQLPLFESET